LTVKGEKLLEERKNIKIINFQYFLKDLKLSMCIFVLYLLALLA